MKQVRRALAHAGYEVVEASAAGAGGRIVECNDERFKFNNYTWLAPIAPAWGTAQDPRRDGPRALLRRVPNGNRLLIRPPRLIASRP